MFCASCRKDCEVEIREVKESYPVRSEETEIIAKVTYCKCCGSEIWNKELDSENLKTAFRKYRENHVLLQPEEIKQIREKYNLSQINFAKILGLGEKTIARYENGSIQDAAQNNLILLSNKIENLDFLLDKNANSISQIDYFRTKAAIKVASVNSFVRLDECQYSTLNYGGSNNGRRARYKCSGV